MKYVGSLNATDLQFVKLSRFKRRENMITEKIEKRTFIKKKMMTMATNKRQKNSQRM